MRCSAGSRGLPVLTDAEAGLVAALKASPLAVRLRLVGTLPDDTGPTLVQRFAVDAPAAYVTLANFPVGDTGATLRAAVVCVARNAAGPQAARQGDGKVIGLFQIMDAVMAALHQASAGGAVWAVVGGEFMENKAVYDSGLQVGSIKLETLGPVTVPLGVDAAPLADFETFHADYDIDPLADPADRAGWVAEPPDHSGAVPELTDELQLQ